MNTDKLLELERKWRREAAALARNCDYTDSAVGQSIQMCADELAAALRAEQAVGDEQIAREMLAEEYEREGYGEPDDKFNSIDRAALRAIRRALGTARQSEGVVVVPREKLAAVARALDSTLGDTDPLFDDEATDEDIRDEKPVWWATKELNIMLAAAPGGEGEG